MGTFAPGSDSGRFSALDAGVAPDAGEVDDSGGAGPVADAGRVDGGPVADAADPPIDDGPRGFVGSPCTADSACDFEGGVCLTDGYPRGYCSLACERLCPDRDGYPTTFCAEASTLSGLEPLFMADGACLARCDYGAFAGTGCRPGYGCVTRPRANQSEVDKRVCVPGEGEPASSCVEALAALGVPFEPTVIADRSPDGMPNLTCHVEDPVVLHPPIHGVDIRYFDDSPSPNLYASCEMARSLVATIDDVKARGVTTLFHVGTYNCRTIAGTSRLSRHSFGDAIDIWGFELSDGTRYTLLDDWEHDTMMPTTPGAAFLYESAYRWFDADLWNIILTPNYNAAHDNHFHVDLTPGSDFIGLIEERYIGPAPYVD